MNELTIEDYKAKIAMVTKDIESLRLTGESSRKLEALVEYRSYLEDELKMLENEKRSRTGA